MADHIYLYVATGSAFLEEAYSNASITSKHVGFPLILVTDRLSFDNVPLNSENVFLKVLFLENPTYSYRDKILGIQLALKSYHSLLFLDSDAFVIKPLDHLFASVNSFDFAACFAPVRAPIGWCSSDVPIIFPEYNSGVMYFRATSLIISLLTSWINLYDYLFIHFDQRWDQASLRHVLWKSISTSNLRIATLPPEFNLRLSKPWIVGKGLAVYIVHSRFNHIELPQLISYLNQDITRFRTWVEWKHLNPDTSISLKIPNDPFL